MHALVKPEQPAFYNGKSQWLENNPSDAYIFAPITGGLRQLSQEPPIYFKQPYLRESR
jgi:hypothetical protein